MGQEGAGSGGGGAVESCYSGWVGLDRSSNGGWGWKLLVVMGWRELVLARVGLAGGVGMEVV